MGMTFIIVLPFPLSNIEVLPWNGGHSSRNQKEGRQVLSYTKIAQKAYI